MKKTRVVALLLTCCMVIGLLAACGDSGSSQQAADTGKVYTFRFSHSWPETHPLAVRWKEFSDTVAERTNGQVIFEMYGAAQLATDTENYEGLLSGILDACVLYPGYNPGQFPLSEMFELPVGYNSTMTMGQVFTDMYNEFDMPEWNDVKVLCWYAIGPGAVVTKKSIKTPDDLKGMQIRAVGQAAEALKVLGASPVSVTMPESYEALSRGTVDGVLGAWATFDTWKLDEVADNYTALHFMYATPFAFVVNKDKFAELPEDLQKIVSDTALEYGQKHNEWAMDDKK